MADIKVVVDAGHGGSNTTPGKRDPDGVYEWNYNNVMVTAFLDELGKYSGVVTKRVDDATGKRDVPLNTRVASANTWGADFYISIHQNAASGKWGAHGGTETFYYEGSSKSKALADLAQKTLLNVFGLRNRGLKPGNHLAVVRDTKMPAILIEGAFMDSLTDIHVLRNTALLVKGGRALAQAFATNQKLSLRKQHTTPPTPTPPTPAKTIQPAYIGKRVESKVDGLRYYSKPSWYDKDVAGILTPGYGFPKILDRVLVNGSYQYKVQNSRGAIFYLTANAQYVKII